MAVSLNGSAQTADGSGAFAAKPGDLVELAASADVAWTSASEVAGAVVLRKAASTSSTWKAQVVNTTKTEQLFTISAKSASGNGQTQTIVLKVAAADARNDEYQLFSGNGSTLKLTINFDIRTYTFSGMQDAGWTTWSNAGEFEALAAEPGTYVFKDSLTLARASNQSKFRVGADTLVGAYPLPVPDQSSPRSFINVPFVATRAMAAAAAEVDGVYNRGEETITNPMTLTAAAHQIRVSAGATKLEICNDGPFVVTRIASCGSIVSYTGTGVASGGTWSFVNDADPTDVQQFSVAKIGTEKALLRAGASGANRVFQVGLPEQLAWTVPVEAIGGDDRGGWSTYTLGVSDFSLNGVDFNGVAQSTTFTYFLPTLAVDPIGMHRVMEGPGFFYVIQSPVLMVKMLGNNSGYSYVGLVK